MTEKDIKQLAEEMLSHTGPILPLSAFKNYPQLPAPQTMRNRLSEGKIPVEWFFKHGRTTMVDMRRYLPAWAKQFTPYRKIGKVGSLSQVVK